MKRWAILAAAQSAPSAGDLQAYRIVVVTDRETKALLAKAALGQHFIAEAPTVLVFFADILRSRLALDKCSPPQPDVGEVAR
ncbi:MAG TPA: nitroreductase family protein [Hyphomicrobiaceae bacterium]|nr:nitroreductase family protein [Hyphomicrobiaceae bacterium]